MKGKIINITLIAILIISLSACSHPPVATPSYSGNSELSGSTFEEVTPTFEDYNAYLAYLETRAFPEDFIHYTDISGFGEFDSFVCYHPLNCSDQYHYNLTDANGYDLFLSIDHTTFEISEQSTENLLPSEELTDLRTHPSGKSGYIIRDGCVFQYTFGEISYIKWGSGNVSFTLHVAPPKNTEVQMTESNTLLYQLLDLDTSQNAVQTLQHIAYNAPVSK